jgi:hypothetical protein
MPRARLDFSAQWQSALVAIHVGSVAGFGWAVQKSLSTQGMSLTPGVLDTMRFAPWLIWFGSLVWLATQLARMPARPRDSALEPNRLARVAWLAGSSFVHLVLVCVLAGINFGADEDFLFGPQMAERKTRMSGERAFFMHNAFLGCSYSVWVAPPGSFVMTRVEDRARVDCSALPGAHIEWKDGAPPTVVGRDGQPLPSPPDSGHGFWGC